MAPSKPYTGIFRRLVIAFDIGTTFSGAAYSLLDPGKIPRILPITRYVVASRLCICSFPDPSQDILGKITAISRFRRFCITLVMVK